jgi:kinesin family protein 2/24
MASHEGTPSRTRSLSTRRTSVTGLLHSDLPSTTRHNEADLVFRRMIKEFREAPPVSDRPALIAGTVPPRLQVYIRKRPLNGDEHRQRMFDVVTHIDDCSIIVHEPKTKVDMTKMLENHAFSFDRAFDESATNEDVYKVAACTLALPPPASLLPPACAHVSLQSVVRDHVATLLQGCFLTVFAYGQTGSGKTVSSLVHTSASITLM